MSESEHDRDERIIVDLMGRPGMKEIAIGFARSAEELGVTVQKLWELSVESMRRIDEKERDEQIIAMMMGPPDPQHPVTISNCMARYNVTLVKLIELREEAVRRLNDKMLPATSDELTTNLNSRTQQQVLNMISGRPPVEAEQTRLP